VTDQWGRVADDGTVYVRTSSGERAVGSYQAGSPEEALAYYGRKYAALALEVQLLEQRAASPEVAPEEVLGTLDRLRDSVEHPAVVGDLEDLSRRLDAIVPLVEERRAQVRAAREQARAAAHERREAIVAEAEQLATSTQWKTAGDRLRELLDEWKAAPHTERSHEQALWKRFSAARNAFDRHRRQHFSQLASHQAEAKAAKQRLVDEAEELASSTDWGPAAARFRSLMTEWKQAGRAGRHDDDALWARFRAAQDAFFTARSAALSERDAGLADNLKAKQALAAEAEALLPVTDLGAAKAALRSIQDRWEAVGHVPRTERDTVEGRLRAVEQAVRSAEETRWRRSNPEAKARAETTVEQLTAAISKLEGTLAQARQAGDERAVTETEEALQARRSWLAQAQQALQEFSG
jgi:hypothetical protein